MAVQADPRDDVIVQIEPLIKRNNLEKYLDYLKEKETDYCIEQEEVRCIQSGIETLVQKIYDLVRKESPDRVDCKKNDNILKVGSFYEGTKNKFPNEFDFIFVLAELSIEDDIINGRQRLFMMQKSKDFHTVIKAVVHSDLKYSDNASRTIYFKKFVIVQGPASKLMFIYQQDKCKDTCLYVDIVPAFKITNAKLGVSVKKICRLEPFRKEIVKTGSYLLVDVIYVFCTNLEESFTETEVHFMKHTLSLKHVTVYKLLKFLIGGHGQAEIMRGKIRGEGFSSYMIKTAMIMHHYECRNTDSEEKGPCVMTVLENLLRYKRAELYPTLTSESYTNTHGESEKLLERLTEHLRRSIQNSTNELHWISMSRKLELKPVGEQRLVMYKRKERILFCKSFAFVIIGTLILVAAVICLLKLLFS